MESDSPASCWLCWEDVQPETAAPLLGCSCKGDLTTAHTSCIKDWLTKNKDVCPNCRVPYTRRVVKSILSPHHSTSKKGKRSQRLVVPSAPSPPPVLHQHEARQRLRESLNAQRQAIAQQRMLRIRQRGVLPGAGEAEVQSLPIGEVPGAAAAMQQAAQRNGANQFLAEMADMASRLRRRSGGQVAPPTATATETWFATAQQPMPAPRHHPSPAPFPDPFATLNVAAAAFAAGAGAAIAASAAAAAAQAQSHAAGSASGTSGGSSSRAARVARRMQASAATNAMALVGDISGFEAGPVRSIVNWQPPQHGQQAAMPDEPSRQAGRAQPAAGHHADLSWLLQQQEQLDHSEEESSVSRRASGLPRSGSKQRSTRGQPAVSLNQLLPRAVTAPGLALPQPQRQAGGAGVALPEPQLGGDDDDILAAVHVAPVRLRPVARRDGRLREGRGALLRREERASEAEPTAAALAAPAALGPAGAAARGVPAAEEGGEGPHRNSRSMRIREHTHAAALRPRLRMSAAGANPREAANPVMVIDLTQEDD